MLAKLISYELKQSGSTFLVLGLAALLGSILIATPLSSLPFLDVVLTIFESGMFFIVLAYVVSTIYTSWSNLYKGRATFELMMPVSVTTRLSAKLIAALIWCFAGTLIFFISGVSLALFTMTSEFSLAEIMTGFQGLSKIGQYTNIWLPWLIATVIALILATLTNAAIMFAAISIAYLSPKFNDALAIVGIIAAWFIEGHLLNFADKLAGFSSESFSLGITSESLSMAINGNSTQLFIYALPTNIVLIVSCIGWCALAWYLMSKHFNMR